MNLLATIFLVSIVLSSVPLVIHAEDENEENESEDEREESEDDNGVSLGSNVENFILYGTIAAIIASIGYTVFKIASSRRKPSRSN
jgi:hypothetical protein